MNVKEIVQKYLADNGYDGIWNADGECCCGATGLFICEGNPEECIPGVKKPCDCGEGCDFHIGMKVSEICRKTHLQNCLECEDARCGDNLNPAVKKCAKS
jgi:hypothetical protein